MRLRAAVMFRLVLLVFVILTLLSLPIDPYSSAEPCAILRVSLPDGTKVGPNPDSWLHDCWLLNLTGLSHTFTVMINNTSATKRSYDTRLVIALNDIGYNTLRNLVVNGTSVPKSAFKLDEPQPYDLWDWPSEDVYPTWFEDTYINVGLIHRKSYKSLVVSATFSNTTGIRMHFDTYGSRVSGAPCDSGCITHNGLSEDSTVMFNTKSSAEQHQPPMADFFYTPSHPTTSESTTFNASDSYDPDGYLVDYCWNFGDGTPTVLESDPVTTHYYTRYDSFTVALTVTDNEGYCDTESKVITVTQTTYCPRYLEVKTSPEDVATIPGEGFYAYGTSVNIDAPLYVPDEKGNNGQRYRFHYWDVDCTSVSGNPINVLMTANHTATAHYTLQYLITFAHSGLDNTANDTIATINSAPKNFSDLPLQSWADDGSTATYTYSAMVSSTVIGKRFILDYLGGPPSPFTVTGPVEVIGHYRVQYFLTITTTAGGTTNPPNGGWFDAETQVTVLAIPDLNYGLEYWQLDGTTLGPTNPYTVIMTSAHTLHAVFESSPCPPETYYLIVKTDPLGVTAILGEGFYDEGSDAVLAAPNCVDLATGRRYRFDYWDVDGTPQGAGVTTTAVHMDANHTAIAHYTLEYYLSVRTAPPGIASIPGEGWYDASTTVPLTAPSVEGYAFSHWDVDGVLEGGDAASITVWMYAPRTATANYQPISVGGDSVVIQSPSLTAWVSINSLLVAVIMAATLWVKRRQRKDD